MRLNRSLLRTTKAQLVPVVQCVSFACCLYEYGVLEEELEATLMREETGDAVVAVVAVVLESRASRPVFHFLL